MTNGDSKEENTEEETKVERKEITNEEFSDVGGGNFISLKLNEEAVIDIAKMYQVDKGEFNLSKRDYCFEIEDQSGSILTCSAWSLYNAIQEATNREPIGKKLKIMHPATGKYIVEVLE